MRQRFDIFGILGDKRPQRSQILLLIGGQEALLVSASEAILQDGWFVLNLNPRALAEIRWSRLRRFSAEGLVQANRAGNPHNGHKKAQ